MDVLLALNEEKKAIIAYLEEFFASKNDEWVHINKWGPDALERLLVFTSKGKMLRGALVLWSTKMLGGTKEDALPVAAAVELLQSALLAHDDIIDKDDERRGLPTVHKQYAAVDDSVNDADHFGMSMSICLGDLALFLAYELVSKTTAAISVLFSKLAGVVCLGQMQDVYFGESSILPDDATVLSMYEHKTATYTFTLPLVLGVLIANKPELKDSFEELGSVLGKLFQLKDDELGLFGTEVLGKPLGSDIVLAKKTLYYVLLMTFVSDDEREKILSLQKERDLSVESLQFVRSLVMKYAVKDLVAKEVAVLLEVASSCIDSLPIEPKWQDFFRDLVAFNQVRVK